MILLHNPNIFRMICFIPSNLHLIPLKWDHKHLHMIFQNDFEFNKMRDRILHIQKFICVLIALQGIACFYLYPSVYRFSFTDTIIYYFAVVGLLLLILQQVSAVKKASSQCLNINGIIQTSKYAVEKSTALRSVFKNSLVKKLDFLFATLLPSNAALYPFVYVFGLHWGSPYKPSLLGFFLLPECYSNGDTLYIYISNIVIKTVICVVNTWTWAASVLCSVYCVSAIVVLCVLSFGDFLQAMEQMYRAELPKENIYENGLFYRKIQVLGCLCNEVQQDLVVPCIIIAGIIEMTIGITAICWIDWTPENAYHLVLFGMLVMDMGALLLICLGAMAQIYQKYKEFLARVTKRRVVSNRRGKQMYFKWKERFYLSCTPVKFKFGQLSLIERLTPLTCVLFSIEQSASLLLVGKKY